MKHENSVEIKREKDVLWKPSYEWYLKTFAIVIGFLTVIFFTLNIVLKPYMRQISPEITPWLNGGNSSKVATE
ncbi:hypothetical protein [Candidatus Endomicrobiellum devescovinae]|jgi:hypothetical protein|uniref:hypothetical protein n=1 Tax=Candidatus Endomicrobiellum devescovinae TaxID=3242322 RepID=UPI0028247389|nr:hypothetical protein [Endomicrobium sp.]MDR1434503.1 hypothetical protein [Endomicrobium sp.]MDR2818892.1 hypothetical protein [Endomicrobium sp.]